ncbi:MAG: ferrochelatase [Propionibacteriaceae bacterium]|nr:ferrochelatase [Propionibacteriaceae bacterium]
MAVKSIAVVLVNMGTPAEPTLGAVQRFLREFLLDKRIVPVPRLVWRPILETSIMHGHAKKSTQKYVSIWTGTGSPLLNNAKAQADALAARLDTRFYIRPAMRYGEPSLKSVLDELYSLDIKRVLVLPMYPQFSTTTVAPVFDALGSYIHNSQDQFEYRTVRDFHDHDGYIEACAKRIEQTWESQGRPDFAAGEKLLLSYHGIPVSVRDAGDPYAGECDNTTALLRERLELSATECEMTYQSKFGKGEWLTPATLERVVELGRAGLSRLDVFCPGFTADCLETEEEIGILNREAFQNAGGGNFVRIECLNASDPFIAALEDLVQKHTCGWD